MSHVVSSLIRQLPSSVLRLPLDRATFLPTRLRNALIRGRLATVLADLERLQDQDLLALRNIGEESVVALIHALRSLKVNEHNPPSAPANAEKLAGFQDIKADIGVGTAGVIGSSTSKEARDFRTHLKTTLEDEMLLEDAYSVIFPGESLSATEVRRRLAETMGDGALELVPNRLRKLLATDSRFAIGPGGAISLSNIPARRNPFDSVAL